MHYKIASFIINASKHQTGSREVYVFQPDSQREDLAGKIFLIAEIGGKKADAKAAIDFILDSINRFYYEDEKIFLQDKVEGLTIENIFEAAVAKINKALLDFLNSEKIFLQPKDSSVTLGLIFEDKLYFSNFGRNKAFLIFPQTDNYELINVETNATDESNLKIDNENLNPKFFSSVISGKVPTASYFLFCNDVLVEYLSNDELINIITKLPPVVAAEQIRTILAKLNSYVPFLGIIIKNTFGISLKDLKDESHIGSPEAAHLSISSLNSTENRTEKILAPRGIFNFKKLAIIYRKVINKKQNIFRRQLKKTESNEPQLSSSSAEKKLKGKSNLIKEKMFFGRSRSRLNILFKTIGRIFVNIFNPNYWLSLSQSIKNFFLKLSKKNKVIFFLLIIVIIILILSILTTSSSKQKKFQEESFSESMSSLRLKSDQLEPYLLYDNYDAAKTLIGDILLTLDELNPRNSDQEQRINDLRIEVQKSKSKIQKLTTIYEPQLVYDYNEHNSAAETRNIIAIDEKIYAADPLAKAIYIWNKRDNKASSILLNGEINSLNQPLINAGKLYYLNDKSLVTVDPNTNKTNNIGLQGFGADDNLDNFSFFNSNFYALSASNNQIYKLYFNQNMNSYGERSNWLKEDASLGNAIGMAITGDIFTLHNDGNLNKFRLGKLEEFNLEAIDPILDSASLLKYFDIDDKNLFIFDRSSKRLVVFGLDGKLNQQYKFPSLNNIKDFSISEDGLIGYILNDDSVYQFDL